MMLEWFDRYMEMNNLRVESHVAQKNRRHKSAQELLNESCDVGYPEMVPTFHEFYTQKILEDELSRASDYSGGSEDHISGRSSSSADSFRPEFQRKKAKLLYMQDEVVFSKLYISFVSN